MIKSFATTDTEKLFNGIYVKAFDGIIEPARRKLFMLDNAKLLADLGVVPGNNLEALKGDRKGQHSIRINKGWRVCFVWSETDAYDVEVNNHYD